MDNFKNMDEAIKHAFKHNLPHINFKGQDLYFEDVKDDEYKDVDTFEVGGEISFQEVFENLTYEDGGEFLDEETNLMVDPVSEMERLLLESKGTPKPKEEKQLSLEEALVSEKIEGNDRKPANAELEDGEYMLYPNGEIQEVVGKDHEEGGEKFNLPKGTLILSNNLKIDKDIVKTLKEDYDVKVNTKNTYAEAVSKLTDKIGLTTLTKDQEFLIKKLKDLNIESPSYETNSKYIKEKLTQLEKRREDLNATRQQVFGLLYSEQENSKKSTENTKNTSKFDDGGETGEEEKPANFFGLDFNSNSFSNKEEFERRKQGATKSGFGKITKDNIEDVMKALYRNFPNIVSREDVFNAGYDEDGNFTYNKDIDFSKKNKFVEKFQTLEKERMASVIKDIKDNPEVYGEDAVKEAENYRLNQTFDDSVARAVDSKLGNFTAGRFSIKTNIVKPEELELLRSKNIRTVKDLMKAVNNGEVDLSDETIEKAKKINSTLSENSDLGFSDIVETNTSEGPGAKDKTQENKETQNLDSEVVDNTGKLVAKKRDKGDFYYIAPDQSMLPPSAIEPHLKVKNRFGRLDPVKITNEANLQELFRQQNFAESQAPGGGQRAAFIANVTANTQRAANNSITQVNIANAQNQQRADQFNINQADRENIAEGNNALDFERRQLTAKAKTEKDLRDYFEFNRKVRLNNILKQQELSAINAMSEDYSIDPFGNTYFDPQYEFVPTSNNSSNSLEAEEDIDSKLKKANLEIKRLELQRRQNKLNKG